MVKTAWIHIWGERIGAVAWDGLLQNGNSLWYRNDAFETFGREWSGTFYD